MEPDKVIFSNWVRELQRLVQNHNPRSFASICRYFVAFAAIASFIYYLPNYSWLEYATAVGSGLLLKFFGIHTVVTITSSGILLNEFLVDRPCTGIQVVATFAGLLIPLPRLAWTRKVVGLILVTAGVYLANIVRILVQIWIYYDGLFDWTTIHGPGGVALGIISVTFLVILLDHFVPEFGDFVISALEHRA